MLLLSTLDLAPTPPGVPDPQRERAQAFYFQLYFPPLMLKSYFNKSGFSKLTLTVGDDEISSTAIRILA